MTPEEFQQWLDEIKIRRLARSDAAAGRLLGVTANSIVNMKKNGTDKRTALACSAVLFGIGAYPVGPKTTE